MTNTFSLALLAAMMLVVGLSAGAQAQGTQQVMPGSPQSRSMYYAPGGARPYGSGYGVPTSRGPLSQPVGPIGGTWYGTYGRQTYPSPHPFGN